LSITLTSPEVILAIQIIAFIGFMILGGFTLYLYSKFKNRIMVFFSVGFIIIGLSILLKLVILPNAALFIIEKAYLEAIIEGTQFIAAFFLFYGLRFTKRKKEVNT
jgi:hypothetical protein